MVHLLTIFLLFAQTVSAHEPEGPPPAALLVALAGEQAGDPAHGLYREGYELILREQWSEARRRFEDLLREHRKSSYRDDALYWSAYALSHEDRAKAVTEYQKLLEEFPTSSYFDDAVADLIRLKKEVKIRVPAGVRVFTFTGDSGAGVRVATAPAAVREFERELRRQERYLGRLRSYPMLGVRVPTPPHRTGETDERTALRIEALYALGEGKKDRQSFETLSDLAQDINQPLPLRESALDMLLGYSTFDVLPVFADVARRDTNRELQSYAIDYISRSPDKERSVDLLVEIFKDLPANQREPASTVLFSVAEVGNDRAVDFLKLIATTNSDYGLRRDAVYYLGNIGGERARAALREILTGR
jgi:tetratricopeptide (TPR) repeat protein